MFLVFVIISHHPHLPWLQERAVFWQPGWHGLLGRKHPRPDEASGGKEIPTGRGAAAAGWGGSRGGAQGKLRTRYPSCPLAGKRRSRQHSAWSSRAVSLLVRSGPEVTPITRRLCCSPPHQTILIYRAQLKIDSTGSRCIACVDSWILNWPHYFELSPPYEALPYLSTFSPPSEAPWACNGATKPVECT